MQELKLEQSKMIADTEVAHDALTAMNWKAAGGS